MIGPVLNVSKLNLTRYRCTHIGRPTARLNGFIRVAMIGQAIVFPSDKKCPHCEKPDLPAS